MSRFTEFENLAWANRKHSAFVGSGYIDARLVGQPGGPRAPYLQFSFRIGYATKRITKAEAKRIIDLADERGAQRLTRPDAAVSALAEEMAETFARSEAGIIKVATWSSLSDTKKDQWTALANYIINKFSEKSKTSSTGGNK